jgi:hypothetical protein
MIGQTVKDFTILDIEPRNTNGGHSENWIYSECPFCKKKKWFQLRYIKNGNTKSCGCLQGSAGELKITNILNENNILFEKEKTFPTLRFPDTNALARFDFYVANKYLIEFDGIQHFEPQRFGNISEEEAEQRFKKQQKHDIIKNNWCKKNNIPLIRIPYTSYDNLTLKDLLLETSSYII